MSSNGYLYSQNVITTVTVNVDVECILAQACSIFARLSTQYQQLQLFMYAQLRPDPMCR